MSLDDEMQEQPRPEPDFRVYVERESTKIDVTHAVMDVYDIAINSMNFGSGFLSTEEVGYLRKLGSAIGAERFDYQHDKCLRCGHDYERHRYSQRKHCAITACPCAGFVRPAEAEELAK